MDLNLTEKITAMEVRISVVEWSPFTSPEGLEILATRPRGLIHYEPRLFCFGMAIPSEPRPASCIGVKWITRPALIVGVEEDGLPR